MKAKVLLRNVGFAMLILAVGITAYGFISNSEDDKVVLNATDAPKEESTAAPTLAATEETAEETKAPETTENVAEGTEAPASAETGSTTGTESPEAGQTPEVSAAPAATEAPTELPSDESGAEQIKTYTLTVTKGTSAMQIANRLEANGIIKSASEFTEVMVSKGVTNDINVGSYEFTSNNTYDQIISALTGSSK